jgi:hypothetical protein
MPEQQDFEFLRTLRSAQQNDQLKQPAESQINQRPAHAQPPELEKCEAIDLRADPGTNRVSEPHAVENFSVETHRPQLERLHERIATEGPVTAELPAFWLKAVKSS